MKQIKKLPGFLLAISLGLSSQAIASSCTDNANSDSTCLRTTAITKTVTQTPTKDFRASAITPFNNLGTSCTTPWGTILPDNGEVTAFQSSQGTYNYTTGEYAADCVEEQRHCTNGVLSGSYQAQNCEINPVNGTCGVAQGAYYTYPTSGPSTSDQCNPQYTYGGVPPADDSPPSTPATSGAYLNTSNNMYYWTCAGEAGGSSASCYAYRRINGQCGSSTNSCNLGNSANPSSYNNYNPNYTCSCTVSGGVTTCSANPSGNQTCAGGYRDTTYTWNCTGINSGATASCSGNVYVPSNNTPVTPPCGETSSSQSAACGTGYSGNQTRTATYNSCNNTTSYSAWNRSSCVCVPSYTSGTQTAACPSGYTGNQTRTTSTNSCTGAVTYGSWNTSSCSAVCNPTYTSGTEYAACPSGYTGSQSRTTSTNSCTGGVTYGSWNTSSCTPASTQGTFSLVSRTACTTGFKNTGYYMQATIKNTGSGTITGINHGCAGAYTPSGGSTTLAPGQSATYECRLTWSGAYGCAFGFNGTNASNSGVQF